MEDKGDFKNKQIHVRKEKQENLKIPELRIQPRKPENGQKSKLREKGRNSRVKQLKMKRLGKIYKF